MASAAVHPLPTLPRPFHGQGCVSFSLKGEGSGRTVAGQQNLVADDVQHAVDISDDVVVPEPQHPETMRFDQARPFDIDRAVRMLSAVKLDHQPQATAGEIGDIRPDGELKNEFRVFDLPASDALPQPVFDHRAVAPQFACHAGQPFAGHAPCTLIQLRLGGRAAKASYPSPSREKARENHA